PLAEPVRRQGLAPSLPHTRRDIDAGTTPTFSRADGGWLWPAAPLKQRKQRIGNESRSGRIEMAIATRALAVNIKPLRNEEMQIVLGAGNRDVEQPPLLFQLLRRAGPQIRRHTAVNDVEDIDGFPLLAFGRMDGRQDQIIFVKHRDASLIARGVRRIECQLGQKALARWITTCNLLQLDQVGAPNVRIFMNALEMWLIPGASKF